MLRPRPGSWSGFLRGASALAVAVGMVLAAGPAPAAAPPADAGLAAEGLYLVHAADCQACHTAPGGTPFAGGQEIGTPFGSVSTPNITPDPDTGIGRWTEADLYRSMHDGIGKSGEYLYPVMPYPSFTHMTRTDVHAIWVYLQTLRPVYAPRVPGTLAFPYDIRAGLFVWRELYFHPGTFRPDPEHSAEWNRGAYLATGAGHCGACHSPRSFLGGTEVSDSYAGGYAQNWLAPNISASRLDGLGKYSAGEIAEFLKSGHATGLGVAFGPMADVVHDSTQYLTTPDLVAIATYLTDLPPRPLPRPGSVVSVADLRHGRALYLQNCAQCHQDHGTGVSGAVPSLAGDNAIASPQPNDVILAMLNGLQGVGGGYGNMPSFAGALGDRDIADITNYVRTAWTNDAPANATAGGVERLRESSSVGAAGSQAARSFDCPRVGAGPVPEVVATPDDVAMLAAGNDMQIGSRVTALLHELHSENPNLSDVTLMNTMIASYCPVVAGLSGLSTAQKRQRLQTFTAEVERQIGASAPASAGHVYVPVPVPSALLGTLAAKAADRHETLGEYLGALATTGAAGGGAAPSSQ